MNLCRDCKWLSDTAKSQHWYRWHCMKAPNDLPNLISGELEPYRLCRFVRPVYERVYEPYNALAECQIFEAGPNCLNPKE